jgi:PilZ domain
MAYAASRAAGTKWREPIGWMEHRKSERRLTFATGRIVVEKGAYAVECAILNLSDHGACLLIPLGAETGDRFTLFIDGSDQARVCTVAWRDGPRIGVSYE